MNWNKGETLPNGAKLIAFYSKSFGCLKVLAEWEKNGSTEYISWNADVDGNCDNGFYGRDYEKVRSYYLGV